MMDFIADLERKVERMKADSETAVEELIQLRGHHQSLKKTHQLLSQQVAYYVQMARNQEQLLSGIQQEIVDLKQKGGRQEGGSVANGHVSTANGEGGQNTCANGGGNELTVAAASSQPQRSAIRPMQLESLLNFSSQETPPPARSSFLIDVPFSGAPPLSTTLLPQGKATANGTSPQQHTPVTMTSNCRVAHGGGGVASEGNEGWIDGSSLRGLLSDVFEENTQETLSLTDLFADDVEHNLAHKSKRTRT